MKFLRRIAQTAGLIALWAVLYPLIKIVLRGYASYLTSIFALVDFEYLSEYEEGFSIGFLVYFTFWYWFYLDGFFQEWEITKFESMELVMCLLHWTITSLIFILVPIILYHFMSIGLTAFTTVPSYVTYPTSAIYFIVCWIFTWIYPSRKIAEVRSWKRSQE